MDQIEYDHSKSIGICLSYASKKRSPLKEYGKSSAMHVYGCLSLRNVWVVDAIACVNQL